MDDKADKDGMRNFAWAMGGLNIVTHFQEQELLRLRERLQEQGRGREHASPRPRIDSPYLTAEEAANYLNIAYSTFRKKAKHIRRMPQTGKYRRDDLDKFAESLRPRRRL